ncbi:lecithin retinol acyltransferase isoform X1 [Morus notabilis]|uniref:lecithin retinol acyltransferase isoform X1 n=1 Tax=Morus notabilis TaxID=981085 RepID=UPI000CED2585|nr:lecithin retinol acyltransferase isoform X1 [Morus notabilis]
MERLLSHEIDRSMLIPGDHIYTYRWGYIYSHHGIYVGGDRVVHFKMANLLLVPSNRPRCKNCGYDRRAQLADAVVKTCLDCFLKGDRLFRFEYEVNGLYYMLKNPGSCTTNKCDPADVVINRARNACIKGFGKYDLVENNCESFAFYCKTGTRISHQVLAVKNIAKLVVNGVIIYQVGRLQDDIGIKYIKKDVGETVWAEPEK